VYSSRPLLLVVLALPACLDDELDPHDGFLVEGPRADVGPAPSADAGDDARMGAVAFLGGKSQDLPNVAVFIALERDFVDYSSWPQVSLGVGEHVLPDQRGEKTVFINALPQAGDEQFRVGTIIVKTLEVSDSKSSWQVHAMAKRGGGFNAKGAYEWEFFELQLDDDGDLTVAWRGEQPPEGENYRTTIVAADGSETVVEANCNDCHISAYNDAILTSQLDLDRF
jgi:hypothetical protein